MDQTTQNTHRKRRRRGGRGGRRVVAETTGQAAREQPRTDLRVEHVPVESLVPWPGNPRIMSEGDQAKLRRSVERFGFVEPVVARRRDRVIVGGHQRWLVAKEMGLTIVPVVFVEVSEAEARALNLALNKISGEWDLPRLGELLEDLRALPDFDHTLSGFDDREIEEILTELERDTMPDPYEDTFGMAAAMLQQQRLGAPTRVGKGQVWELGRHRLLCGDSLAGQLHELLAGAKADLVLTDAPYGVSYQSTLAKQGRRKEPIANDEVEKFDTFLERALPVIKSAMKPGGTLHWFAGGGGPEPVLAKSMLAIAQHLNLLNVLVWDKVDPGLGWRWRRSWEAVIEAANGRPSVWNGGTGMRNILRFPKAIPQSDSHPTPKPVPLLAELIKACCPTNGLVVDPFAGSGSTLIASELTGRTCVAVELEARYSDIVVARWEALTKNQARLREGTA